MFFSELQNSIVAIVTDSISMAKQIRLWQTKNSKPKCFFLNHWCIKYEQFWRIMQKISTKKEKKRKNKQRFNIYVDSIHAIFKNDARCVLEVSHFYASTNRSLDWNLFHELPTVTNKCSKIIEFIHWHSLDMNSVCWNFQFRRFFFVNISGSDKIKIIEHQNIVSILDWAVNLRYGNVYHFIRQCVFFSICFKISG